MPPCSHNIILSSGLCYFCNTLTAIPVQCEADRECPGKTISVPSMTAYSWDGIGRDPNEDLMLCKDCGSEYTENMLDQLNTYYSGLL